MKILQISFLILFIFSLIPLQAEWELENGEELTYSAKWTGIPAGEIEMQTVKMPRLGENMYEFRLKASTSAFWSMVYKVRDTIHSRVNVKEKRAYYFYKDVKQGRRHLEEKSTISYEGNKIIHSKQNFSAKENANIKEIELDEVKQQKVLDPLSIIYLLRSINFNEQEESEQFNIFAGKGIYELKYLKKKSETLSTRAFGSREVWLVEPSASYKGGIVDAGRLQLWIDKKTGIALKLMFHIPVGWATLELKKSNNSQLKSKSTGFFRRR